MSCNLCNKKNKFKKFYDNGNCNIAKISLNLKLNERDLIYTITNTGTVALCNDFYICSKLYRKKLKIENKLLLENEVISITMSLNDIKDSQINETEITRAYIKIKECIYICSDSIEFKFENGDGQNDVNQLINVNLDGTIGGVYITKSISIQHNTLLKISTVFCSMVNNGNSESDASNVRFTLGYGGIITNNLIFRRNNISKFQFVKDSIGVHGYIPLWKKNETYSFSIECSTINISRPTFIPFYFNLTSDNKFGQFTNYIEITFYNLIL